MGLTNEYGLRLDGLPTGYACGPDNWISIRHGQGARMWSMQTGKRVNGLTFTSTLLLWTSPTKEFGSRARTYVPDNYRACTFFLFHLAGRELFFSISVQVMYYT